MKVSEGLRRTFIVLSAVYWVVVLLLLVISVANSDIDPGMMAQFLVIYPITAAVIYGVLSGVGAGVVWIIAGFRKSKPADE